MMGDRVVMVQLYRNGFKPNYWIWTNHGEERLDVDNFECLHLEVLPYYLSLELQMSQVA